MKLYEIKIPFILDILYYSTFKALVKVYRINKRIKGLFKDLKVEEISLDIYTLYCNSKIVYLLDIETLRIDHKDNINYNILAKEGLQLSKIRCKTLYTWKIDEKGNGGKMQLPIGLKRLYYTQRDGVILGSPTLEYIHITRWETYNPNQNIKKMPLFTSIPVESIEYNSKSNNVHSFSKDIGNTLNVSVSTSIEIVKEENEDNQNTIEKNNNENLEISRTDPPINNMSNLLYLAKTGNIVLIECGEKLEIEYADNVVKPILLEDGLYKKVEILRENVLSQKSTIDKLTGLKELHIKYGFGYGFLYRGKYKIYLHVTKRGRNTLNYITKEQRKNILESLPNKDVILVQENGEMKEYETAKECLEYLFEKIDLETKFGLNIGSHLLNNCNLTISTTNLPFDEY